MSAELTVPQKDLAEQLLTEIAALTPGSFKIVDALSIPIYMDGEDRIITLNYRQVLFLNSILKLLDVNRFDKGFFDPNKAFEEACSELNVSPGIARGWLNNDVGLYLKKRLMEVAVKNGTSPDAIFQRLRDCFYGKIKISRIELECGKILARWAGIDEQKYQVAHKYEGDVKIEFRPLEDQPIIDTTASEGLPYSDNPSAESEED